MLDLNNLIGYPKDVVIQKLEKDNIKYSVVEQNSTLKTYDTVLVVKVEKNKNVLTLITDKFLLNI